MTKQDQQVAAAAIVEDGYWLGKLQKELRELIRLWTSFHRHAVLSMSALALLAIAAARPPPRAAGATPAGAAAQPAGWGDTGILPASPHEEPPGDPGMVKVSVPEARRLLRLTTTPMTTATRQLGHAWFRWRRRHQARARYYHYQVRLRQAQVT